MLTMTGTVRILLFLESVIFLDRYRELTKNICWIAGDGEASALSSTLKLGPETK
jgi:hypothetical protein